MTIEFTYTSDYEQFASLLDRVTKDRAVIIIQRRGNQDVAMIAADELARLTESAYLLRSPRNAERLFSALGRALKNEGQSQSTDELRHEVGQDEKERGGFPARVYRRFTLLGGILYHNVDDGKS